MRMHKKVWLWWGRWWAVQIQRGQYVSLGIHVDCGKPYLDLHFGWCIASIGNNPVMTYLRDKHRGSSRGMFTETPIL